MSNPINKENFELIFFQLFEGGFDAEEEKELLSKIANDSFLAFEWENWKKAKLPTDDTAYYEANFTEFFDGIKNEAAIFSQEIQENPKRKIIPLFFMLSSIAACLLIAFIIITYSKGFTSDSSAAATTAVRPVTESTQDDNNINSISPLEYEEDLPEKKTNDETEKIAQTKVQILDTKISATINLGARVVSTSSERHAEEGITRSTNPLDTAKEQASLIISNSYMDDILKEIDTTNAPTVLLAEASPKRKLTFKVEKSNLPPKIILTSLAQLSDLNIDVSTLMEDQKVFVVRSDDGLFLRLEKDGGEIYVALR
jgi:hypothetical protein